MGHQKLADIAKKHDAKIDFKPVDFGLVFPATGGLPLNKRAPERIKYRMTELIRWRDELGLEFNLEPKFFPTDPALASKVCFAAEESGADSFGLGYQFMKGVWENEQQIADENTIREIVDTFGLNGNELLEKAADEKYDALYKSYSEEAINNGAFGAPSYIIDGELFWGQDRLYFVEKKLKN